MGDGVRDDFLQRQIHCETHFRRQAALFREPAELAVQAFDLGERTLQRQRKTIAHADLGRREEESDITG